MLFDLCDKWLLECGGHSVSVSIPATNASALLAAGAIPDPYVGTNEKKTLWLGDADTVMRTTFVLSEDEAALKAELVAEYVDTVFEAKLNGRSIGRGGNAFIPHRFDVTGLLSAGENTLEFSIRAPKKHARAESGRVNGKRLPGITDVTFIRKPQCHFGWDWGLDLPVSGILGKVYLELGELCIRDFSAVGSLEKGFGKISVSARVTGADEYIIKVTAPDGSVVEKRGLPAKGVVEREFEIPAPYIWRTADISGGGEQPLYEVELTVMGGGERVSKRISTGIRSVYLDRKRSADGEKFCFVLNGKPIFIKGANWIPADAMPDRVTREKLEYYIDAAVKAGFNMLRVWGGGYYGSDEFYSLCDKKGILVWQDFMFACRAYPFFDDEFEANALSEVGYNATRLKSHPSLALWCGNNEIEAMYSNYMMYPKYVDAQRRFFYETLPRELEKYDDLTPYIPGSPIGADFLKGVQADNVGDTHLWAVWHGLQDITYYRTRKTRFCSEFGFESFPDIRTIRQYASEKQMSLYSETMRAHQKCALGNEKTYYYMTKLFGDPKTFSDTVYLSQLQQAVSVSDAVSAWRRSGVTSGAMYWQFNDCWPVASWSSVDYFGRYKALQYAARRFNASFAVTAEEEKGGYAIYAVNDYTETKKGEIAFTISDFYGKIISEKRFPVEIEGGGRKECAFVPFECGKRAARRLYFAAVLTDEKGEELSRFSRPLSGDKKASLPVPKYDVKVSRSDGYTEIAVTSDVYSRFTEVFSDVDTPPYDDNFVDIFPGETRVFRVKCENIPDDSFGIRSVNTVSFKRNALVAAIKRALIFLNPVNFFSWIYYKTGKFEYKE